MKNQNNNLNIKKGDWVMVLDLKEGIRVALPTLKDLANARVLKVEKDGGLNVHWKSNYNVRGDFRSEVMQFNANLVFNTEELEARNAVREANGLMRI